MYVDTHAHLTCPTLKSDIWEILSRAKDALVDRVVNICTDEASLTAALALQRMPIKMHLAASTTPHDVEKEGEQFFPLVKRAAEENKLIAIGETGLDYYYEHSPKACQKIFLSKYFALAIECGLPLIFHCRDAFSDLFDMADSEYRGYPGLVHCFTGDKNEAKLALERGWYVSFSGIVTFKKSEELRKVVEYVPPDRILIETDAPYLAPNSKRGKTNEPAFIGETARVIAQIKEMTLSQLADITSSNAETFFSFSKHESIV